KSVQECMKKDVRLIQQCDKDKINEITPESGWDPLNFDFLSGVDIEAWENHMHIVRKIEICPDFYIPSFINIDTRNMLNSQRRMGMKGKGQLITCDVIISKILQDNCDEKKKMSRFL
ncbi:MAG: hypothetical protein KAI39_12135, partial [Desulfobulbaceae bacterium]|nr:hypothetical protein [Desulfobulbaceae bacterium]